LLLFYNTFLSNHHGFAQLGLGALSSYDTAPAPVSKGLPLLLPTCKCRIVPLDAL